MRAKRLDLRPGLDLDNVEALPVGLAWVSILAFLRISTHYAVFANPLSIRQAVDRVDEWLRQPTVRLLEPTERHWSVLRQELPASQAIGPLLMDAHLAALAIEHDATLFTTDRDFSRFEGARVVNALDET